MGKDVVEINRLQTSRNYAEFQEVEQEYKINTILVHLIKKYNWFLTRVVIS